MEYKIGDVVKIKNTSLFHKNQMVKITELGRNGLGNTLVSFNGAGGIGIPTKHLCQTITVKFGG